ncbi:tRNA lysidine(34) synthetase TilS [Tsukamurella sp. 8F]|uniref:tRNA lysidine(34) synthetase TilS n=1 Tax=unclassified Tsukamurella TaxID=2633480 RepID=UPI0023B9FEE5|nr:MULTISPECIES: tRNA lysidine(34) synthetase TilS [unclassified Tsukamurella]MDF0530924.1 tRNA lysidine(34) synthetase TilS [Tsukamurella sp. 8J]MDF0588249.1 tRNA lysidine(34) synthetase TilS [Tsukamurella sp. 8F]
MGEARRAVLAWHRAHGEPERVCAGLSGGADSLTLVAALAQARIPTTALVIDHGLQPGSNEVAAAAAAAAARVGCPDARVVTVDVGTRGGPEAAARDARYAALDAQRGGAPVLLAHTLDDQAETVLLGLGRGSGARSLAGMRAWTAPYGRPLLGVRRAVTVAACAELGEEPYSDPHNADPRFTRVRLRTEALPLLEDVLGGGVAEALARTADVLRADGDTLDAAARAALADLAPGGGPLPVSAATLDEAVRRRVLRDWLAVHGARACTYAHLTAVERLLVDWHGQGPVAVPGGAAGRPMEVVRHNGALHVRF